ncbi:GatB/YqeY domain-containing protein [Aeromonas veronii]
MSLKDQLKDQQKLAMLAKDKARLGAIRLLMAEIKQREVDTRIELNNDEDILAVVTKMVKQRRDSISQFEAAGRQDLADKESAEIVVLQEFLPQQLTADEIAALIEQAITESGAAVMADMGKVMAVLKPKIQGRADVGAVSAQVKTRLA